MKITRFLAVALLLTLVAGSLSAYVLLSPRRTWDGAPNLIVDSRGNSTITDGSGGTTRIRNAIVSASAWNGAGTGTRINSSVGSVASFTLGDGQPMLMKRIPGVSEASIGHGLTADALEFGMVETVRRFLRSCGW